MTEVPAEKNLTMTEAPVEENLTMTEVSPSSEENLTMDNEELPNVLKLNSVITVNVDNLSPGLIVATYTHQNGNLYQGALFQINRERGIPCGISFPKDFCTGAPANDFEQGSDLNPNPINQRQTYFQDLPSIGPIKALRRIHRATKPPARFKNGKIAFRLRNRPILCSKCKAYCEEKNPNILTAAKGSSAEKSKTKSNGAPSSKSKTKSNKDQSSPPSDDPLPDSESDIQDDYTSVGATGIIDTYWKRPTLKSILQLKVDDRSSCLTPTKPAMNIVSNPGGLRSSPRISEAANELRARKTKNLKLCINKLTTKHRQPNSELLTIDSDGSISPSFPVPETQATPLAQKARSKAPQLPSPTPKEPSPTSDTSSSGMEQEETTSASEDTEIRTRKRSSAVPARFRDSICVSKSVFNFKKRRQLDKGGEDSSDGAGGGGGAQVPALYLSRVVSTEEENAQLNTKLTVDVGDELSCGEFSISPKAASSKSSTGTTGNIPVNDLVTEVVRPEPPARTPTIKISFGSSGNGVVVQIPPKLATEDPSSNETKASKKAMKRAKKEAKRKLYLKPKESQESSLQGTPILRATPSPLPYPSPDENQSYSPLPPILVPHYQNEPSFFVGNNEEYKPMMPGGVPKLVKAVGSPSSSPPPKKKKKEKKKKKDRTRKSSTSSRSGIIVPLESEQQSPGTYARSEFVAPLTNCNSTNEVPKLKIKITSENGPVAIYDSPSVNPARLLTATLVCSLSDPKKEMDARFNLDDSRIASSTSTSSSTPQITLNERTGCLSSEEYNEVSEHINIKDLFISLVKKRFETASRDTQDASDPGLTSFLSDTDAVDVADEPLVDQEIASPSAPSEDYSWTKHSYVVDAPDSVPLAKPDNGSSESDNTFPALKRLLRQRSTGGTHVTPPEENPVDVSDNQGEINSPEGPGDADDAQSSLSSVEEENGSEVSSGESSGDSKPESSNLPFEVEEAQENVEYLDFYLDESTSRTFKKGDLIWGKVHGCPHWPGTITSIFYKDDAEDVRANVSWFRAARTSVLPFTNIDAFDEQFNLRYMRNRRRGSYQGAVKDALLMSLNSSGKS